MGSYGIGVTRTMAAVVEQHHDEKGIIWPMSVAPFHVTVCLVQNAGEGAARLADEVYEALLAKGVEAVIDDRDERPGVKFNDADIVGIPIRITVGKKAADGIVEYKRRDCADMEEMGAREAVERAFQEAEEGRSGEKWIRTEVE